MSTSNRKTLTAFIAQHIEMGETEWFFKPDVSGVRSLRFQAAKPLPKAAVMADSRAEVQDSGRPEPLDAVCTPSAVSEGSIASQNSLDALYSAVCGCMRCPLGKQRTHFVFGQGNPGADLMFVGEAPGQEEDAQGLAFVGRAGQLLTRMIKAIKLSRDEVFIGNILKCRPPGNRDPLPSEIEQCEPILLKQIEIIRPTIICALGRIAGQTLLRTKSTLGALRGKVHDYHGVKLVVTYHPAALLRNPNWKPMAWDDLKYLRREYDGTEIA